MIIKYYKFVLVTYIIMLINPAYAAFAKAQKILTDVAQGLRGLSITTVTIAIFWVGYKLLFGGSTLRECWLIILGAILIASGSELARLFAG